MLEDYLTTKDVSEMAKARGQRITPIYIARLCQRGTLKATKVGRQWWIHKDEVADGARFWRRKPGRPKKEEE